MDWNAEAQATLWGAAATFLTGGFAVIGAVVVGLRQADIQNRQAGIAERQTKILDRQTALAELTLRKAVFDERFAVYRATYDFLLEIATSGFSAKKLRPTPVEAAFLEALERATFLFRPSVADALQALWSTKVRGDVIELEIQNITEIGSDKFTPLQLERQEKQAWLREQFEHVADIFGSEMRLSDHDMQLG